MLVDWFYKYRFSYDKSGKLFILCNKINTVLANMVLPGYVTHRKISKSMVLPDVIVSLTTYPPRIEKAALCIDSLIRQTVTPNKIILWLAKSDYDSIDAVPYSIRRYLSEGLEIRFCEDIKSYKKIFYTAKQYSSYCIVTADDDFFYPSTWLEELYETYSKNSGFVICHRSHRITYNDGCLDPYGEWDWYANGITGPSHSLHILTGAGALFPPYFFKEDFFDIDAIRSNAPTTDDMWVKVYALKHNIKVMKVKPVSKSLIEIRGSQRISLISINQSDGNDRALQNLVQAYDINIIKMIESEED